MKTLETELTYTCEARLWCTLNIASVSDHLYTGMCGWAWLQTITVCPAVSNNAQAVARSKVTHQLARTLMWP